MKQKQIDDIREFNRKYTAFIGILNNSYLKSKYSLVEVRVMSTILKTQDITANEIVKKLNIDKSYLSRLINGLERKKLINRKRSEEDSRYSNIFLTSLGKTEIEDINIKANENIKNLFSHYELSKIETIIKNLNEVTQLINI